MFLGAFIVGLKIVDSLSKVKQKINSVIASTVNKKIQKNKAKAQKQIKSLIRGWIEQQPEVISLKAQGQLGSLNAKFGLPPGVPDIAIETIIGTLIESVDVIFKKMDSKGAGGIKFVIRGDVIRDILNIPQGTIVTKKGVPLNWLQWLLTRGNETVVSGYKYVPGSRGRSGGGTMMGGSSFRVEPARFAGTVDDNFVTRAFSNKDRQLSRILRELLKG